MKDACEVSAARMAELIAAALNERQIPIPDKAVPIKLGLIAKIGVINEAHGDLVPSGGTEEAASASVVDKYVNGDALVQAALTASEEQLRQQVTALCTGHPFTP